MIAQGTQVNPDSWVKEPAGTLFPLNIVIIWRRCYSVDNVVY